MSFEVIKKFEEELGSFTGSPYVVATDCCTHALELCLRLLKVKSCALPAQTYISVPMTLTLLNIDYTYLDESWQGEYNLQGTDIWDSARCLRPGMYRAGQYQCLSFGPGKPLMNIRGGAILLDNEEHYKKLKMMSNDGRDLSIKPWQEQKNFEQGFHYMMRIEEAISAFAKFQKYKSQGQFEHPYKPYPDCRTISIHGS